MVDRSGTHQHLRSESQTTTQQEAYAMVAVLAQLPALFNCPVAAAVTRR